MNVAVIYGGRSGEHEISLVSASSIVRGLSAANDVTLLAIDKDGRWYLQPESERERILNDASSSLSVHRDPDSEVFVRPAGKKRAFFTRSSEIEVDIVFPALHGTYGEDGTIQGLFEMADIPYVGCSVMSSSLAMDKEKTKLVAEAFGIPVVPYVCITRSDLSDSSVYDEIVQNAVETLGFPLFVKPCSAGSSNGASKASDSRELSAALAEAFLWDDKVLVEKCLDAREIECSVTGNSVTSCPENRVCEVKAYIPGEIRPTHEFYDFDAKYNDPDGAKFLIPADLSTDMSETIRSSAVKVYRALDCSGLSRVDFFIDRDSEKIYLNEINTMPGFTPISMFPKMCEKAGVPFSELLQVLAMQALGRFESKRRLQTSR